MASAYGRSASRVYARSNLHITMRTTAAQQLSILQPIRCFAIIVPHLTTQHTTFR